MSQGKNISRRKLLKLSGAAAGLVTAIGKGANAASPPVTSSQDSLPQVPRKVLGKTGKSIPILLFGGAVNLDPRFDPKLAEAFRFGVNYIDAADCYGGGRCEDAVGSFHTRLKNRQDLWLTSKSDDHDPEGFEETLHNSLKKLKTDYIDLYFLHSLSDPDYVNDKLRKVVEKAKQQGKIRHFGFSCHKGNVAELLQLAARTPWVEAVMFRYNFRMYGNKELNAAIDAAHKANVGLIAMKTQGSEASFQDAWKKFEKTGKWNKHQAVLKAVWADERITAAVSHMENMDQLRQNIAAALDKSNLTVREVESLNRYADATRSLACDGCDHLCGAQVEAPVHIGDTLRFLMYHEVYNEPEKARRLFQALPPAAQAIDGVDFSRANQACPNGLDVGALMRRASAVLA